MTCLIGNGQSIAYNPDLTTAALKDAIVQRFEGLAGSEAAEALSKFAASVAGEDPESNFEKLLGPLDTVTLALPVLEALAGLAEGAEAATIDALAHVTSFTRKAHTLGIAQALQEIAEKSHGNWGEFDAKVQPLCTALLELPEMDNLTVATLNYDGLLHAGLIDADGVADLALGYGHTEKLLVEGGHPTQVAPLRTADDFPAHANRLVIQLHGSLGWVRINGSVWKVPIDTLRTLNFWQALTEESALGEPVVVLTDRKEAAVTAQPFALAYDIFGDRLARSSRWLIAGYGFGDRPVNSALARALAQRRSFGAPDPTVLVIGHSPPVALKERAQTALEVDDLEPLADGSGLPDAVGGAAWEEWKAKD